MSRKLDPNVKLELLDLGDEKLPKQKDHTSDCPISL